MWSSSAFFWPFKLYVCWVAQSCPTLCNPMDHGTTARLLCPSGFSRQEYWTGLPCPPPGDLHNPGLKPRPPALQVDSLPSEQPGKPFKLYIPFDNYFVVSNLITLINLYKWITYVLNFVFYCQQHFLIAYKSIPFRPSPFPPQENLIDYANLQSYMHFMNS